MSHPQTLPNPTIQMVLNNNVVVTVDASGRERVLMGRGLGFQKKRGDAADASRVDKTFVLDAGERGAWERALLQDVPYDVIRAAANAVSDAERSLGRSLGVQLSSPLSTTSSSSSVA